MLTFTKVFNKMMNFQNIFRWHIPILCIFSLLSIQVLAANTLLILGDSLTAGYQLPIADAWATRMAQQWQQQQPPITIINASISGDTTQQGLVRLPSLLIQHKPRWVLIELGANDGLRGFEVNEIAQTLSQMITLITQTGAEAILMQIRLPPNYGRRYTDAFAAIYPKLAQQHQIPLMPFFMATVVLKPEWIQQDGLHPTVEAQPFIAQWVSEQLKPLLKNNPINKMH